MVIFILRRNVRMVIAMMISSPTLLVYLLLTQLDFYTNGVKYYSMFDFC